MDVVGREGARVDKAPLLAHGEGGGACRQGAPARACVLQLTNPMATLDVSCMGSL